MSTAGSAMLLVRSAGVIGAWTNSFRGKRCNQLKDLGVIATSISAVISSCYFMPTGEPELTTEIKDDERSGQDGNVAVVFNPSAFRRRQSNEQFWRSVQNTAGFRVAPLVIVLCVVALAVVGLSEKWGAKESGTKPGLSNTGNGNGGSDVPIATVNGTIRPFPPSGSVHYNEHVDRTSLISTVSIVTPKEPGRSYLVRFRRSGSKSALLDVFLGPGESVELWLPRGEFEPLVLSGSTWRGQDALQLSGVAGTFISERGASHAIEIRTPVDPRGGH